MLRARPHPPPAPERRVYCNRTLNLRSIKAIGFDLDYTSGLLRGWDLGGAGLPKRPGAAGGAGVAGGRPPG